MGTDKNSYALKRARERHQKDAGRVLGESEVNGAGKQDTPAGVEWV